MSRFTDLFQPQPQPEPEKKKETVVEKATYVAKPFTQKTTGSVKKKI
jgi:hypothetical protein